MQTPCMYAHHLIFCAYGFWLPNDPRGSWSSYVGSRTLYQYGPATTLLTRESHAYAEHDHRERIAAKSALKYPPIQFTGRQAAVISYGFERALQSARVKTYACAIMPNHVHIVTSSLPWTARYFVNQLKGKATEALRQHKLHPFQDDMAQHSPWNRNSWEVQLYSQAALSRAIEYVKQNPIKEGLRQQP